MRASPYLLSESDMHPLRSDELYPRRYVAERACVIVRVVPRRRGNQRQLVVEEGSVGITKGAEFAPLPSDVNVCDSHENPLAPTWGFWISIETCDPYHLLLDWDDPCLW